MRCHHDSLRGHLGSSNTRCHDTNGSMRLRQVRCRGSARDSEDGTWSHTWSFSERALLAQKRSLWWRLPEVSVLAYAARMDRLKGAGYRVGHLEAAAKEVEELLERLLDISKSRGYDPEAFCGSVTSSRYHSAHCRACPTGSRPDNSNITRSKVNDAMRV